jgi:type II secretory pathway component PulF
MAADPYQPPQAPPPRAPVAPLPGWAFLVGLAATVPPTMALFYVVPQFAEVFRNFDAPLPWLTHLFLTTPWVGLAWTALVALDGWRVRKGGGTVGFLLRAVLGSMALFLLIVASMYWPVFSLAATV